MVDLQKQVETVGQIYMAACGAPERTNFHCQNIADLALDMVEKVSQIGIPGVAEVNIRIGMRHLRVKSHYFVFRNPFRTSSRRCCRH